MFVSAGAALKQTPWGNALLPAVADTATSSQNAIVKMENMIDFASSTRPVSLSMYLLASKDIIFGLNNSPS